jgi:hypothetical protein
MDKSKLPPTRVVLDLVLKYEEKVTGKAGTASVTARTSDGADLVIFAKNHRGNFVSMSVPVFFAGPTYDGEDGPPARWVLTKIAPGVWKPSQSILSPDVHAYVTVVGVPDPAPWEEHS